METLVIDNFNGSMTQYVDGNINSGLSNVFETYGNNPFIEPGNLTWNAMPVQIDAAGSVITDLILAGKERVESGILYVYAIGHTGRLYKIQVNNPATFNPDYDNPVLLATLTVDTPTFTRGGFIDFYGATEKIYIGHDKGVNSINFDGTGEAAVGVSATWTQTVPRPLQQFLGKLYIGNGSNIAEVDTTATVTTYTKLSPGFPTNSQVRDIDVSPDGTYLETLVAELPLFDITSATQETSSTSSAGSYIFKWNGTDTGYTSFTTFPTFALGANHMFGNYRYTFGSDQSGTSIFAPVEKIIAEPEHQPVLPNAVSNSGNILSWMTPYIFDGHLEGLNNIFGQADREIGLGYFTQFIITPTSPETDVIRIPCQISVSNFGFASSSAGYANNVFGTSKIYFSTLETSAAPTTAYRFYKWVYYPSRDITFTGTPDGLYQTQNQLFSKKITVKEVRVYGEPWTAGVSFTVDLIGSSGNPITNGSKTFTVQNSDSSAPMYLGTDYAWWNPSDGGGIAPTYSLALRITNAGETNHVITKVEIDYTIGGK